MQIDDLSFQVALLDALIDNVTNLRRGKRLGQIVGRAAFDRFYGAVDGGVRGDHHHQQIGTIGDQLGDEIETAGVAETDVEKR